MKKCTWCGKQYTDEVTACAIDGQPLQSDSLPGEPTDKTTQKERSLTMAEIIATPGGAVGLMLVILFGCGFVMATTRFPLVLALPLVTAIWAVRDASSLRQRIMADPAFRLEGEVAATLQTTKPIVVFAACFIAWIYGFPWYLVMRGRLQKHIVVPR